MRDAARLHDRIDELTRTVADLATANAQAGDALLDIVVQQATILRALINRIDADMTAVYARLDNLENP